MVKFEKVSKYKDEDIALPMRATAYSAGYDFTVAANTVIPPLEFHQEKIRDKVFKEDNKKDYFGFVTPFTLDDISKITKETKAKPTLVPTGVKCYMEPNQYLQLSVRSSLPLKHWLILANEVGIVDSDYVDNSDNEGEIFFQLINLSPFAIELNKGDRIGQGIILNYGLTDSDEAKGERTGGYGSTGY